MALNEVKMEIGRSAEAAAAKIKAEADAEIAKIIADADAQIAVMNEKEEKRLKDDIARLERQELSSADLEGKKIVLAKKKEVLAKAFDEALSSLENAPADKKLAQYKMMVASASKLITNPKAYLAECDKFTASDLGLSSVAVDSRMTGGIIFESEDGTLEVDMQYRTILQTIWDREIKSISDILFG